MLCLITPLSHLLTNSSPVLSYCHVICCELHHSSHPHELCHTHTNSITPMHIMQCSHDPQPTPAFRYSEAPTPFPIHNNISSCILFFPNLLEYISLCILLCSNSNPALPYYVIPPCIITLVSSISLTSHLNITDLISPVPLILLCFVSSIKSHLHVCIRHFQISTTITTIYQLE